MLISFMPLLLKVAKHTDEAEQNASGPVHTALRNLDTTCSRLKWNCADGFQRPYNLPLGGWVRDYPEQVIVTYITYCLYLMYNELNGGLKLHSIFQLLVRPRNQHSNLEQVEETNMETLHTLGVYPIHSQF